LETIITGVQRLKCAARVVIANARITLNIKDGYRLLKWAFTGPTKIEFC